MESAPFTLKVCMLKVEVMETLLYGGVTRTLGKEHFAELRTARQCFSYGPLASSVDNAQSTSCRTPRPSRKAKCESVEVTIRKRLILFAGAVQYSRRAMSD